MIKSITVTNYRGDSIELVLARPELSGFVITSIEGLGPGKATINTTEIATNDGSLFNSSRLPSRNIVISLKYLWKDTIEDVRQLSYKYFPIKQKLKLLVKTDNREATIEGYVESNEPQIFSENETADISIICPNPFFYSSEVNNTVFSGIEPMFEFPFCNDSLTENLLIMSEIYNYREMNIIYEGDAEIGVIITIHAIGEVGDITIYNTGTRETMTINTEKIASFTGSGIVAGDDIVISTVTGNKYVNLVRAGETTNIINCIDKNSSWFKLSKGDNVFAYVAEEGLNNIQFSVQNQIVYEGV